MWSEAREARLGGPGVGGYRLQSAGAVEWRDSIVVIAGCPGSNLLDPYRNPVCPPPHALQNQATAFMGQLAAVCNHLVAYDVRGSGYTAAASTPGSGEWPSDGSSTMSDSTEPYNGGRRADIGAQAGAYPNSPLARRTTALHADFGSYLNPPLAMAMHSEIGAPVRFLSSQHPHAKANHIASVQGLTHAVPLGGVLEPQYHTASFGALAAAAPQGGVHTAPSQTASFAPLGWVYAAQDAERPRAEHAIAGSRHMGSPLGIAQSSNPAGMAQASGPSGIVAAPSGLASSGTAPTSGAPSLPELTGDGALGTFCNQLATAPNAESRASLIATLVLSGTCMDQLPLAEAPASLVPVLPRVELSARGARKEQAIASGGGSSQSHLGIPKEGVGKKIPAGYARGDTAGGAAQLPPRGGLPTSQNSSLPPSPPSERVDGSTSEPGGAEGDLFTPERHLPTPDTGSTVPRRVNGALLRGAAATALAHRQRQQRPAADYSASLKRRLAGPTGDDAARLPLWRRSVPLVVGGNLRSSVAIVAAAIFVNGPSLLYLVSICLSTFIH